MVVTGGTAGIGRAAARCFARDGARVAVLARGQGRLNQTRRELLSLGAPDVLALPVDVADAGAVERAAETIERELGPITVWVNNAMATVFAPFHEITTEEFERVTQVTYLGTVNGTRAALRHMRTRREGCIVQVGSALAYRSIPLQSAYCGAKAAARAFTDAVRCELIHDGVPVHVTMVQLSAFNTPQFSWARSRLPGMPQPVMPVFDPELAGAAIVRAAAERRREWWVGWPAVRAILSTRVVPGLGDHLAAKLAYKGQVSQDAPADTDNLFEPVSGDFGIHGRFQDKARQHMWQPRGWRLGLGFLIASVALVAALLGTLR